MAAAACFTLGGVHLVIWSKQSRQPVHLLFSLMAVAAGFVGLSELLLLHEETIAGYHQIIRWQHLPIFTLLTPMVWAVHLNFGTGRIRRVATDPTFAATLEAMGEDLVRLSEDVHAIANRLHPAVLEDLGLSEALASECARFSRRENIPCEIRHQELTGPIPKPLALGLFRFAQEALRNSGRHARASAVTVNPPSGGPRGAACDQRRRCRFRSLGSQGETEYGAWQHAGAYKLSGR